jgi:hypothetical protein
MAATQAGWVRWFLVVADLGVSRLTGMSNDALHRGSPGRVAVPPFLNFPVW